MTFKSGMVDNAGIAVEIATTSLGVQKLFSHPVLLTAILNFGNLSSSTNVDQRQAVSSVSSQSRAWSKMWGWPLVVCLYVAANSSYIDQQKIIPGRVPLVFQLAPGTGKSYVHSRNVKTSGIGPSWNRF